MTKKLTVKSIGIISLANLYALIAAFTGALGGFFYGGILSFMSMNPSQPELNHPEWLILLALTVGGAVSYGFFAWIGTLISGLFLNLFLKITGGLTLQVES